eukprot:scaffold5653_cov147-Cylindrotheca_fusiformis.AAC.22
MSTNEERFQEKRREQDAKEPEEDDAVEEEEAERFQSVTEKTTTTTTTATTATTTAATRPETKSIPPRRESRSLQNPSVDPYVAKLERYELFCTNQSYYLVGCNKLNTAYRVLKMDRTRIELPLEKKINSSSSIHSKSEASSKPAHERKNSNMDNANTQALADTAHTAKQTLRPLHEFLTEDRNVYTQAEIQEMLDMIHDGNRLRRDDRPGDTGFNGGGLKPIAKAYGIVGFVRFLDCYYLTLITRRAKVGSIGGNGIYTIKNTETFPIKPAEGGSGSDNIHADPSSVLLSMWNRGKRSVGLGLTNREIAELRYQGLYQVVDLTKNFFFSYTYDLTRSLQENFLTNTSQPFPPPPFKDMFAWNFFLTRELEGCTDSSSSYNWVMPIIHGAFVQRKLNDYGRSLNVMLLARRSRHFAGTRYLKRGVSEQGKVANDVEHEQIVHDESKAASKGIFSSYLQVRGSIPTFWTQETSLTLPKPPIELNRVDPTYTATQLHFEDLLKRYGSPIVVLDLVKQSEKREREVRVGNEFRHAIDYINTSIDDDHKIRYCALDYSHISKHRHLDVSTSLNSVSTWAVNQTGFFCSSPNWKILEGGDIQPFTEQDGAATSLLADQFGVPVFPMEQTGILRTNCIDCLDRTNVAQFSAGVQAMEQQLVVMGIRSTPKLDPSSNIVRVLIDMYVDIGDSIALQYGGSEAHKKVSTERNESIVGPIGKHKELLTSIRRYYSNAFTDRLKQDAMNLFLGYYLPFRHAIPLWEMETDYYLHNFHSQLGTVQSMKGYQLAFGVHDWAKISDEIDASNANKQPNDLAMISAKNALPLPEAQSRRIQKVRNRCDAQNLALSSWWKVAIQANVQQRMWMQLGRSQEETMLPPRYERIYQPEKIAQFDRFFARSWATPVRRTHSAQHGGTDDELNYTEFRRNISGLRRTKQVDEDSKSEFDEESCISLEKMINDYGFAPPNEPTLKSFVEQQAASGRKNDPPGIEPSDSVYDIDNFFSHSYIGDTQAGKEKRYEQYAKYAQSEDDFTARPFRAEAIEEFKEALHANSLNADDVAGIRKLTESAHIGRNVTSGRYKGFHQGTSAIEVATVIHEQFNALDNMRNRGELREGIPLMDAELKRRGFYTDGVKGAVKSGWDAYMAAEKHYSEVFTPSSTSYQRSDLTTENSLKLYSSLYPPDKSMPTTDLIFVSGKKPLGTERKTKPLSKSADTESKTSSFVAKAAERGIPITAHLDRMKSRSEPLFKFKREQAVPVGFEMINEGLFASKKNKFMVFNGAAVDSWRLDPAPITKTSGIESMLLGTLK